MPAVCLRSAAGRGGRVASRIPRRGSREGTIRIVFDSHALSGAMAEACTRQCGVCSGEKDVDVVLDVTTHLDLARRALSLRRPEICGSCMAAALHSHREELRVWMTRRTALKIELERRLGVRRPAEGLRDRLRAVHGARASAISARGVIEQELHQIQQRVSVSLRQPPRTMNSPPPRMLEVEAMVSDERARLVRQLLLAMPLSLCGSRIGPDDAESDAALGHSLRLLHLLSSLTGRPLLHAGVFRCSRSTVWRGTGVAELPLWSTEGRAVHHTEEAVRLLCNSALNIAAPCLEEVPVHDPLRALATFCSSVARGCTTEPPPRARRNDVVEAAEGWECL